MPSFPTNEAGTGRILGRAGEWLLSQFVKKSDLALNVKDFGAVGDGVTDDTAAIQSFVNQVTTTMSVGIFPKGRYLVSSTIIIPERPGWALRGLHRETTVIVQATDNIPVFDLGGATGTRLHSYEITDMTLTYSNFQPATNTDATGIVISAEPFEGTWRNLTFERGYYGNRVRSGINAPWGHTFDDITFDNELSGGAMEWAASIRGIPNNRFGRLFVDAQQMTATIFDMRLYNCKIDTIEVIQASKGPILFVLASGGKLDIGAFKLENGDYAEGKALFYVSTNCYVRIGHLTCSGQNMHFPGGSSYLLRVESGSRVDVGYMDLFPTSKGTGASVYAIGGGNVHVKKISLGAQVNGMVNHGGTATGETVTVADYVNNHITQSRADADYTVALGSPNKVAFNTALTAPRVVSLPNTNNSLFNGLYYEFIFNGAINGANTVAIKCGSTTLRTQDTDKAIVGFTYRRHAFDPAQGWVLTKYETLP